MHHTANIIRKLEGQRPVTFTDRANVFMCFVVGSLALLFLVGVVLATLYLLIQGL